VKLRETALNLLLSASTVALVLGGGEAFFRLRERSEGPPRAVASYITNWQEWDGDFYTVKSTAVGWPPWEDYNRDGLRDREHLLEKPKGVRRLICLGDSTTMGWGIRAEEAYPQVLQDRLDVLGGGVEVFSVALGGWSTRQERIAYLKIARRYRPDQVLLGICLNDIPELQNNLTRPPAFLAALHRRSALVRGLVRAREREIASVEELFTDADEPRVKEAFARLFAEVRELRDAVQGDGAAFGVLLFPFRVQTSPGAFAPTAQAKILEFCAREGIPVLDLLPALRTMGQSGYIDYDHFSPPGARLVAETILESGLVEQGEAGKRPRFGTGPTMTGAAGVGALLEGLDSADPDLRASAARALGNLGGGAGAAVPALAKALEDPVPDVRSAAAWALGGVGEAGAEAVPALVSLLGSETASARAGAAWALGRMGPKAKAPFVINALIERFDDPDDAVRFRAGDAVLGLNPGPIALKPLLASLERTSALGRDAAAEALGGLGPAAREAVPALALALQDPREEVRWRAAWALGRIGGAARPAVPALIQAMEDAAIRWHVCDALAGLGPEAAAAVPRLTAALRDESGNVRWRAAQALGAIGPAAVAAAPALVRVVSDTQENVRVAAVRSLALIGAPPAIALPVLRQELSNGDDRARKEAADALGRLGRNAAAALPDLMRALEDAKPAVRTRAAHALGRIGPLPLPALLALKHALEDTDETVRLEARRAIAKAGSS
jgi:HEAT repeat protein/lysophospholipase L1-like esterase